MAKYQKTENCGPVPYPDQSGKLLLAGETVEGDGWEPLVALGFVVKVAEVAAAPVRVAPPKEESKAPVLKEEPKAAILKEEPQEVSDVVQTDDGAAVEAMDPPETGKSSDEGMPGRTSTRRRR